LAPEYGSVATWSNFSVLELERIAHKIVVEKLDRK
jgi:hypothetical protein